MGQNMARFKKICKEKGLLAAFSKAVSYVIFLARKSNLERMWKRACLKSDRLEVRGWNTGPRIYWDGREITKSAGLNVAIFVNGKWHDSSKTIWRPAGIKPDRLTLKNRWTSLPISQTWIISRLGDNRVSCEVTLESKKDTEFIEQKFILMLSEKYDKWFDSVSKKVKFPDFKDWSGIREVKKDSPFIGVQSDVDKGLPNVTLKKSQLPSNVYSQIENSDVKTKAPVLGLVASCRDKDLKYKRGSSAFFKAEIELT